MNCSAIEDGSSGKVGFVGMKFGAGIVQKARLGNGIGRICPTPVWKSKEFRTNRFCKSANGEAKS
jgi:hypothetical protein